jgi:hypothetical protein
LQFVKSGDNTYQIVEGQRCLIDSNDNYNVSADGSELIPKPHHLLTKLQFRCLFTPEELIGLDNHAQNATLTADQQAAMVTVMKNFDAASAIDLCDPRTIEGVQYIESIGLIAAGRAAEILVTNT